MNDQWYEHYFWTYKLIQFTYPTSFGHGIYLNAVLPLCNLLDKTI